MPSSALSLDGLRALSLALALLLPLGARAEEGASRDEASGRETVVRSRRANAPSRGEARGTDDPARSTATPEEALEALAGVTLTREGGPLAPARLRLRGLAGSRVLADVEGLPLVDPATGGLDAAMLPLFASVLVRTDPGSGGGALGGRLSLEAWRPSFPTLRARIGAGTLDTTRASLVAGTPLFDGGHIALGLEAGLTSGRFAFVPAAPSLDRAAPSVAIRENNDQQRASALVTASTSAYSFVLDAVGFASAHEGGIPGFATAPTEGLRGRSVLVGARGSAATSRFGLRVTLEGGARYGSRATFRPLLLPEDAVRSVATDFGVGISSEPLDGLAVSVRAGSAEESVVGEPFSRACASLEGALAGAVPFLDLRAEVKGGVSSYSGVGLLPRGVIGVEVGPWRPWAVGARLSHDARAPSLDELYSPRGFVLGNPELRPERSTEAEVYARLRGAPLLDLRFAAFAARMDEAILFLHVNAFEVQPLNTGPLWRAGLEGSARIAPHRLLSLELTATALASRVDLTEAPLPVVPPLAARLLARLGEANGHHLALVLRHRGETTSNLYGTLPVPAYTLFDAVVRWPISPGLAASFAVTNLFDVKDARDANLLPLPGRQAFASLEVEVDAG